MPHRPWQRPPGASAHGWGVRPGGDRGYAGRHHLQAARRPSNVTDAAVADAAIVHLWDELASHVIWYSGLFLILLSLAGALREVDVHVGVLDDIVAALVALTLVNTYIEGAQPWMGLVFLAVLLGVGLRSSPRGGGRPLAIVGALGLVLLLGWGLYWYLADGLVFPEFSDLGWI